MITVELEKNELQTIINAMIYCSGSLDLTKAAEFNELARISQKLSKAGEEDAKTETGNE